MSTTEANRSSDELVTGSPAGESKSWNWHPRIPIQYSPVFTFPPNPVATLKWFVRAWLPLTELTCYLLLAMVVWRWVQPSLAETQELAVGWVGALWARNFIMMALIASVLHLWLYRWRKQDDSYRYMRNAPTVRGNKFFAGHQLRDNVFWTLASGVTIWSLYETIMWLAYANGVAPSR